MKTETIFMMLTSLVMAIMVAAIVCVLNKNWFASTLCWNVCTILLFFRHSLISHKIRW